MAASLLFVAACRIGFDPLAAKSAASVDTPVPVELTIGGAVVQ